MSERTTGPRTNTPSHPRPLPPQPESIPPELRAASQWVAWRYEYREDKWTKPPVNPHTGKRAKTTDSTTWGTFDQALAYSRDRLITPGRGGVGFVVTEGDPFLGVDIDGCRDPDTGDVTPGAREIVAALDSYTEISPSGTGLRIIVRAKLRAGSRNRNDTIEIYDRVRFFTLTGHRYAAAPLAISERQAALDALHARLFPAVPATAPRAVGSLTVDDDTLIKRAHASRDGELFARLWAGDTSAYDGDESRADMALCGKLASLTGGDAPRIERLFDRSGLVRPKWTERADYRQRTIAAALSDRTKFSQPSANGRTPRPTDSEAGGTRTATAAPGSPPPTTGTGGETAAPRFQPRRRTDYGNAERLIDQHGPDLHYVIERGAWTTWEGTRWAIDETGEVERRAKQVARNILREALAAAEGESAELGKHAAKSEAAARLSAMIELARSELGVSLHTTDFDREAWLLNCKNGVVDLRTGTLRAHDRAELHMKRVPVDYDPAATCPTWRAFLTRIMADNDRLISFLQRAVGYSLTGTTREQVFFILHGVGANGKSTLLETLAALLDDYAQQAPIATFLRKQHDDGIPNDIARMVGARLISAVEADEGVRLSESLIKQLTGGDRFTARFLHKEFFDFTPEFKLWLSVNHRPTIRGTDHAIWRRPLLIPFTVVIPDEEQDKELKTKLRAELPGILAWAVQGCLDWQRDGLGIPAEVRAATSEYRAEMDTLGSFFEERCVKGKRMQVTAASLYTEYKNWCEETGERPETQTSFGRRLTERDFVSDRDEKGKRSWFCIALRSQDQQATLDPDLDGFDGFDTNSGVFSHENVLTKNPGEPVKPVKPVKSPPENPSIATPDRLEPPPTPGDSIGEAAPPTDEDLLWQWSTAVQADKERGIPVAIDRAAHRLGFTFDRFAPVEREAARLEVHLTQRAAAERPPQRTDEEAPRG